MLVKRRPLTAAPKRTLAGSSVAAVTRSVVTRARLPGVRCSPLRPCSGLSDLDSPLSKTVFTKSAQRKGSAATAAGSDVNASVIADLPPPTHVKIVQAEYVKSSASVEQCPEENGAEFAVVGRSNVGKSSLINMLTGRRSLALVSKTPGKTKLINHFLINKTWYLVDLPGYGYAKSSKEKRIEWSKFTKDYFLNRGTLANVLLLIDASVPPQRVDVDCANWLGDAKVPFSVVFTKTDKRKKKCPPVAENMEAFRQLLLDEWEYLPAMFATSSRTSAGKEELLRYIAQLRNFFTESR